MTMSANKDVDLEAFQGWYERTKELYTIKGIAILFQVTERTVQNWLADGLDCHLCGGNEDYPACSKYLCETGYGNMRWGLHPAAVLQWLIARNATPEPGLLKLIREKAEEVYRWTRKNRFPGCVAKPPKRFTWDFYGDGPPLQAFMAWFWNEHFVKPSKGEITIAENPFIWVTP